MDSLDYLIDQNKVKYTINTLFIETDNKNWDAVKECFAGKVLVDMVSMGSIDKPELLTADQITENWSEGFGDIDILHHQAGNYKVTVNEDKAEVFCYGIATHYKENGFENKTKTFVGSYEFELRHILENWKISKMKFNLKFKSGYRNPM